MAEQKFFKCEKCGNLVGTIKNSGVPMICCGEKMHELVAKTQDEGQEKHLPVVIINDNTVEVKIGSTPHPMTKEHCIEWVYLQVAKGGQRKALDYNGSPEISFCLGKDDEPIAVFAHCNIHGLWKTVLAPENK